MKTTIKKHDNKQDFSQTALLEQYKLYVEMTDRVSSRRADANKFYISLLSGLFALLSIVSIPSQFQKYIVGTAAILGIALCFVWVINIRSYKELNSLKFKVIHEMEKALPYPCYDREWEILKNESDTRSYFRLTRIEQYVPFILMGPYIILLIYAFII